MLAGIAGVENLHQPLCLPAVPSCMPLFSCSEHSTQPVVELDAEMLRGPFGSCSPVETTMKELLRCDFKRKLKIPSLLPSK